MKNASNKCARQQACDWLWQNGLGGLVITNQLVDFKVINVYKWRGQCAELIAACLYVDEAARLIEVDPAELSWAVEEHGRCDCGRYIAVKHGSPTPERLP